MGIGKKYNSHIKIFVKFCREKYTDLIQTTTEMGTEFLTEYFKTGLGYSSVNSARSALSNIKKPVCNVPFGKSPLVFSKGFLILDQPCQHMLKNGILPNFLLLSSQNWFLQLVI